MTFGYLVSKSFLMFWKNIAPLTLLFFPVIYNLHILISDSFPSPELTTSLREVQANLITCKCIETLTQTITYFNSVHQIVDLKGAQVTGNSMKVSLSPINNFFLNIKEHLTFSLMISYLSMNSKNCSCVICCMCCPLIKEEFNSRTKRGLKTLKTH